MNKKKTKIVATIGPASESEAVLTKLVQVGMNVIRLNFSHGSYEEHGARIEAIRRVSKKLDQPIAVLLDLPGPKIRIGEFYQERVKLVAGQPFVLSTTKRVGDETGVYINYAKLPQEVAVGSVIFLDDGKKKLVVEKVKGTEIYCQIVVGGETKGRRGVNVPGAYLSISSLTPTDKKHVAYGVKQGVDFMALSFVRRREDIDELRTLLNKSKADIKIIAKIETAEAIENIDEIIAATDGVMVARGDLAVEVPKEEVPILQKMIIKKCNKVGKPVITATQMLESMIGSPVPTRAEVNDVANAIFDGTDAVMLSEETTLGIDPVNVVETMRNIALKTEQYINYESILKGEHLAGKDITDAISFSALNVAHEVVAQAIVALSTSGYTARMVSRYKPSCAVVVITPDVKTFNRLSLSFGCDPILLPHRFATFGDSVKEAKEILKKKKLVKPGDRFVLVGGLTLGKSGTTNTVSVQQV
ncbi:MAG: pyruvate kinase [Candidatus Vogelbacteria bacterium RIFOXYD1_FULL_46_19]|uniref:Pyruvate kinase n=1 Tax=Candidatus Vogelbacteria bacterium RIFOXYD1_FULL_46_19 TaxID=1802439 RepID=A0A1G2QHR3_9BACT|nr:MAG: pyruvate kinase [Candidatus Vogelbacteria bacterium RIFOXYD1_FULL_46_19]